MIYSFGGEAPANHRRSENLLCAGSNLSDAEIQQIRDVGDALIERQGRPVRLYGADPVNPDRVKATGANFPLDDETRWVWERLAATVRSINDQRFGYELSGFENFYYLSYGETDHFNWHLDQGSDSPAPRKLSLVLQLSDPSEYDGGDFQVMFPGQPMTAEKGKGIIMAFPAHKIHRVTPVTRGIRRALAMFAVGPSFR